MAKVLRVVTMVWAVTVLRVVTVARLPKNDTVHNLYKGGDGGDDGSGSGGPHRDKPQEFR